MSIRNIHSQNIPGKSVHKADRVEKPSTSESDNSAGKTGSLHSDQVQISGKKFSGDLSFARNILSGIDEKRLESIPQIRKNIEQGAYNTDQVQETVGKLVGKDLERLPTHLKTEGIPEERVRFLTENENVADVISKKIQRDLKNL